MAIIIKPRQALGFLPPLGCGCATPYCQPIETTDITMIQGNLTPSSGTPLLLYSDPFDSAGWTLGAGWSIAGGILYGSNVGGGATAASIGNLGMVMGRKYLIGIKVTVTSVGSASNNGWILLVNNEAMHLPDSTPQGDGYDASFTGTWIYTPTSIMTDDVVLTTDENTIDFNIEYINIAELSEVGLGIYNGATQIDLVTSFTGDNSLNYYYNGQLFTGGSLATSNIMFEGDQTFYDMHALFELKINDWASITDYLGCMTVRLYDTILLTERIRNGDFTQNELYWDFGNFWAMGAGSNACYTGAIGVPGLLSQIIYLEGGSVYTLSFDLSIALFGTMLVHITTPSGTTTTEFTGTTIAAKTLEIDLTAFSGATPVTVAFGVGGSNPDTTFCIDTVSVLADDIDSLNETGCINLRESHDCTLYIHATNDDNAFGMDYTTGNLEHWLRIYGKIKYSGYPEEKDIFKFSDNSYLTMFASPDKEFEVTIGDAAEYMHDCLSTLRLHDTFQIEIDGTMTDFSPASDYDLSQRRSSDNSQATFIVREKTGVSSNYNCT